jgi:hypothetical protein
MSPEEIDSLARSLAVFARQVGEASPTQGGDSTSLGFDADEQSESRERDLDELLARLRAV